MYVTKDCERLMEESGLELKELLPLLVKCYANRRPLISQYEFQKIEQYLASLKKKINQLNAMIVCYGKVLFDESDKAWIHSQYYECIDLVKRIDQVLEGMDGAGKGLLKTMKWF